MRNTVQDLMYYHLISCSSIRDNSRF